jgi:cellulose synthase/poly-beta-1,6-N-acetylglucosamine synthase-like glycosyltransferase
MGQHLVRRGVLFGLIPHEIYIAPPTSASDFYRQRRRWLISIFWAREEIRAVRPVALRWVTYRYIVGWTGVLGLPVMVFSIITHPSIPLPIEVLGSFNLVSYFAFYQYGAYQTSCRRYSLRMAVLQIPVSFYEGGTLFWSLLRPPNPAKFEVIRKV